MLKSVMSVREIAGDSHFDTYGKIGKNIIIIDVLERCLWGEGCWL